MAEVGGLAVAVDLGQAGGEAAQRPEPHADPGGDVASGVMAVGGDHVVGNGGPHVDHQRVLAREEAPGPDGGRDAVRPEGVGGGVVDFQRQREPRRQLAGVDPVAVEPFRHVGTVAGHRAAECFAWGIPAHDLLEVAFVEAALEGLLLYQLRALPEGYLGGAVALVDCQQGHKPSD